MTQWCTSRSIAAAVIIASLKIDSQPENAGWLDPITLPRSYRSASRLNSTSHLLAALLHVAQVIQDQHLVPREVLEPAAEPQVPLGRAQVLHHQAAVAAVDPSPRTDQFLSKR